MSKHRDIVYIIFNSARNEFIYHGIEFKHFILSIKEPVPNILLLKHNFSGDDYQPNLKLTYVKSEDMGQLMDDNIYQYGDFSWLDFKELPSLEILTPIEIAEILYFGHMGKPIDSPFNSKLKNRFAYYSHDDGWFNKIYCRNVNEFTNVLSNYIAFRLSEIAGININPLEDIISNEILKWAETGILIDFRMMEKNSFKIPLYRIGKHYDIDELCNNLDSYVNSTNFITLQYLSDYWMLR